MSSVVSTGATLVAFVLGVATVFLLVSGQYFFAGFLLTLIAFVIYFREINLE